MPFGSRITRAVAALLCLGLSAGEARLGPGVPEALGAVTLANPLELIVTFEGTVLRPEHLALLHQLGLNGGRRFEALPIVAVLASPAQARQLVQAPGVRSLWLNRPLAFFDAAANHATSVDRVQSDAVLTAQNGGLPVKGHGVTVMVNDSGIDATHADLPTGTKVLQNVMGSTNLQALLDFLPPTYVENVPNSDTNSGHGTHCAGIIAGNGNASAGLYTGVAPDAKLVGYGSGAALSILDALGGLNYGITHKATYGIRVISNSWGAQGGGAFDPADPINVATWIASEQHGLVIAFAAGNDGPAAGTHNPYAKAPWVISVAAGTKAGGLADFSSRGTAGVGGSFTTPDGKVWSWVDSPSVTAPGVDYISTRVLAPVSSLGLSKDATTISPLLLPYYTTMSGTSMATPHVAGLAALLLEANPALSPAQVKELLQATATAMPGRASWEVGAGYANAFEAVKRAFALRTSLAVSF